MNTSCRSLLCSIAIAVASFAAPASAQTLLSVDFNGYYYSATQSGFTGIAAGPNQGEPGNFPASISPYTVNVSSSWGIGQYQNGEFVPTVGAPLYKDYVNANGWGELVLTIGGLTANTTYNLRTFNWLGNADATANLTFTPVNGTVGAQPTYTNSYDGSVDITAINQFSTLMVLTSNNLGELSIQMDFVGNVYGGNVLNGFELSSTVPEPGTATLFGLGLASVLGLTRRRKATR